MLGQNTDVLPVFDHCSEVDETAKRGISAVDDQISIWFLLLQYSCKEDEKCLQDNGILQHLHWLS